MRDAAPPLSPSGDLAKARVTWRDPCASVKPGHLAYMQFCALRTGRRFLTHRAQDRDLLLVVDSMPEVEDMRLRPAVVGYWHRGAECHAEPALWVRHRGVPEFWYVPDAEGVPQDAHEPLRQQLLHLRIGLRAIDLLALLSPYRVERAATVRRHARLPVPASHLTLADRELRRAGPVQWDDVLRGRHPILRAAAVCRLVFNGLAHFVPHDRLRPETCVEAVHANRSMAQTT